MATLTYADLIADYPELSTTNADSLTRIDNFLDIAEQTISLDAFKSTGDRDRCRLALAAHLTALANSDTCASGSGSRAGAVTGRSRGSRSVTYANPGRTVDLIGMSLGSTRYGQIVQILLSGARHRRVIVG